jgi:hypothetical protein
MYYATAICTVAGLGPISNFSGILYPLMQHTKHQIELEIERPHKHGHKEPLCLFMALWRRQA